MFLGQKYMRRFFYFIFLGVGRIIFGDYQSTLIKVLLMYKFC